MHTKSLGHYHLGEKIGEGGMGVVYRATDSRLQRDVAVKILNDVLARDAGHMARFEHEARILAGLDHPNIAVVHDFEDTGDVHALVMEFVEGPTLAERLRCGPMTCGELLDIARQITDGVVAAHARGIIHRDLKPANIKITPSGRVKILDFGLARSLPLIEDSLSSRLTTAAAQDPETSTVAGTVPYMAPEQLRGDPVDTRTDIYAFGVVLHEMATGRRPFAESRGAKLIGDIQHVSPPPIRSINPSVSRRLEDLVTRCLEKDPERRYSSMATVREELDKVASDPDVTEKTLAVLYFENLSPAREDALFCDGITEDIMLELSRIRGLTVLSRSSVRAFRNRPGDAQGIGRELNVSHVLDGSLRRVGNRLRITAHLLDIRADRTIWMERYDRQIEDVFAIQDDIARSIARALKVMLSRTEEAAIAKIPTTDIAAYEYYLGGRQRFQQFRRRSIEYARELFAAAVEIDPNYARAHAGLADCHAYLYMFWEATPENLEAAERASRRAVELDPDLAEGHVARGVAVSLGDQPADAVEEFEKAIQLDPNFFEAYYFCARGYYARGELEQAVSWFARAAQVRPEDYQALVLMASALNGLGRKEEAEVACRQGLARARKHLELNPGDARALYFSAVTLCTLGEQPEQALTWAEQALAMDAEEPQVLYNVACVYALLGRPDDAIGCLEAVITHGDWWRKWMANDPDLASLREDPRYRDLVKGGD